MTEENLAAHRANGQKTLGPVTPEGKANSAAANLRKLWRLTNMLFRVGTGALTLRDVKNEDRPGYVDENTSDTDKMSVEKHDFLQENVASAP